MTFIYPLGLVGLVGIPILIIVYIIKNRYTEQVISSTYLWRLSERFLKKRVPISIIAGLISLILQILIVTLVSFALAQPVITLADSASSYCFILDASGSMNFVQDGQTRFDLAKQEINGIIEKAAAGSEYTLIYAGSTTETWFEKVTDKNTAIEIINEREVAFVEFDEASALEAAEKFYNDNRAVKTYLVTDKDYEVHENVNVINVSAIAENYALTNINYGLDGGSLIVTGTVKSYGTEDLLMIDLYFDGEEEPSYSDLFPANQKGIDFKFICSDRMGFESMRVQIANDDNLVLDNSVTVYDVTNENISDVLLVSDNPFFINAALVSAGVTNIKVIGTEEYDGRVSCGLYVFDSFMPGELPTDGAIWFFNPIGHLGGTNFSYQNEITAPRGSAAYPDAESSSKRVNQLLTGVTRRGFELKKYIKCGLTRGFTELITCDGNPILFVGTTANAQKEVVFAFDVRDSAEFNLYGDFSLLIKNLVDDCFSPVIGQTNYYSGDYMLLNNVANFSDIKVLTPSGKTAYLDTYQEYSEYQLTEAGVYTVVLVLKDKTERTMNVFAALPEEERFVYAKGESFSIRGDAKDEKLDGYFDPMMYIFILITVLAISDFGVYCYEQYQLR